MLKLNLGCGLQCPDGWTNIDSSFGVRLAKNPLLRFFAALIGVRSDTRWPRNVVWMDITRKFTFPDDSVQYIYSSHTFEHLSFQEAAFALNECFRVLKKGGVIRLIVPDLERLVNDYLSNKTSDPGKAAEIFHANSLFFEIPYPRSSREAIGFFYRSKNNHRFLYDREALRKQLAAAGFSEVAEKKYAESAIPHIELIDIKERFNGAICLEATKR